MITVAAVDQLEAYLRESRPPDVERSPLSESARQPRPATSPALARDTAVLEALLGDVLEEQEGRAFRDRVFWLRATAARVRDGEIDAVGPLVQFVHGQHARSLEPFVRACSIQLCTLFTL